MKKLLSHTTEVQLLFSVFATQRELSAENTRKKRYCPDNMVLCLSKSDRDPL